jgi:hypothetical protein
MRKMACLGLQGEDVLVITKKCEREQLNALLASGGEGAINAIQTLLRDAFRFDVKTIVRLADGQTLRDLMHAKLFNTRGVSRPVLGGEPLIIDSAHLRIDAEVERIRAQFFKLAESRNVIAPDFSVVPTDLTHGMHIADIAMPAGTNSSVDAFEAAQTIRDRNPFFVNA